jgi:hypothetical protein
MPNTTQQLQNTGEEKVPLQPTDSTKINQTSKLFELTVMVTNPTCNNPVSHASVIIKDCANNKFCRVSFYPCCKKAASMIGEATAKFYMSYISKKWCGESAVRLYSDINLTLEDFVGKINKKFCCFETILYNCSDAANYTLNYFFPPSLNCRVNIAYQAYKLATFPCCIATLGCTSFFGAPPLTNGPVDVLKKAQLLSKYYGDKSKLDIASNDEPKAPTQQTMKP